MSGDLITTSVPFKTALMSALAARSDLAGIQCQWTYPGDTMTATSIYYGKTKAGVGTPVMAGPRLKRQEDYTVEIIVDVIDGGNDVSVPETTAHSLLGSIDDTLANQVTTIGPSVNILKAWISSWETHPYNDLSRQGWAVLLKAEISVSARLS